MLGFGRRKKEVAAERLPPHSEEAELGVLGCIMLDPGYSLPRTIPQLDPVTVLYIEKHRIIYQSMLDLFDEGTVIDPITLSAQLQRKNQLEGVGGIGFLAGLGDKPPSHTFIDQYLDILRENFILRELIRVSTETVSACYDLQDASVEELLDKAEHSLLGVATRSVGTTFTSTRPLVTQAMQALETQCEKPMTGLPSGYGALDRLSLGFHPGDMVVFAARPSVGKTALMLCMADYIAVEQKTPVGILSLEMLGPILMKRMLSSRAKVNLRHLNAQANEDIQKLADASRVLARAPIYIDDERGMSILRARAKARRMWSEHGIKILFIDYLQYLTCPDAREDGRQAEVAAVSRGIRELAGELKIPVVVLAMLNRELDKDKRERAPRLSDIKDSGQIEQDSDMIGLMHRVGGDLVGVNIAKQRNGPTGEFQLVFLDQYTRFENVPPVDTPMI